MSVLFTNNTEIFATSLFGSLSIHISSLNENWMSFHWLQYSLYVKNTHTWESDKSVWNNTYTHTDDAIIKFQRLIKLITLDWESVTQNSPTKSIYTLHCVFTSFRVISSSCTKMQPNASLVRSTERVKYIHTWIELCFVSFELNWIFADSVSINVNNRLVPHRFLIRFKFQANYNITRVAYVFSQNDLWIPILARAKCWRGILHCMETVFILWIKFTLRFIFLNFHLHSDHFPWEIIQSDATNSFIKLMWKIFAH